MLMSSKHMRLRRISDLMRKVPTWFSLESMGAVAASPLINTDYGRSGSSLVGDEIAAGVVAGAKKRDDSAMLMLAMLMMSG